MLTIQQLDIDYYINEQNEPVVRLYGLTSNGISVAVNAYGYYPYFYIEKPLGYNSSFRQTLNKALLRLHNLSDVVIGVCIVERESIYGFSLNGKIEYLKIFYNSPQNSKYVVSGFRYIAKQFGATNLATFEDKIDFTISFLVDAKIYGCCWIDVPFNSCVSEKRTTSCKTEIETHWSLIRAHTADSEWSHVAPIKILSFDIEVEAKRGTFPEAEHDPVITIGNVIQIYGQEQKKQKTVFTLGSCNPIHNTKVVSCHNESELLHKWVAFLIVEDPDVISGYNIENFDIPYLITRAEKIGLNDFAHLGRVLNQISRTVSKTFFSNQTGNQQIMTTNIDGRIQLDVYRVLKRDHKLRSYTLNAVSAEFLGDQKEDVHYTAIPSLQNGDANTRRQLASYCLKDALLPLKIVDKLMIMGNLVEMARVTGVPINLLLHRGQQVKVSTQLLHKSRAKDFIIPTITAFDNVIYEGGLVMEAKVGFYDKPIGVCDFASLYPSIMIAHNLCYSTLIDEHTAKCLNENEYITTPTGEKFVKRNIRKGILVEILENLIKARKECKDLIKTETDIARLRVLDGRQLAIKVSANSVYGFTGASKGMLPCISVCQSVTSLGREIIANTAKAVTEHFCVEGGYSTNAKVIYGDTDSIMVDFGVDSVKDAIELSKKAVELVNKTLVYPLKLEFEKVFCPFLLTSKKRYAGLSYDTTEKENKVEMKGMESVRRDFCKFTSLVVERCLKKLLYEKDPSGALAYCQQQIFKLSQNKVDLALLVISRELRKSEYASKQPHAEVAKKMSLRDAASAPKLGDRVPFVFVELAGTQPAYKKAEDPDYVLENNLSIDTKYYVDHQLFHPLLKLLEPIYGKGTKQKLQEALNVPRKIQVGGVFSKLWKKQNRCLKCRCLITDNQATCEICNGEKRSVYLELMNEQNCLEEKFSKLFTQCQRCHNNLHQEVACQARGCPIYYMRKKTTQSLLQLEEKFKRFEW